MPRQSWNRAHWFIVHRDAVSFVIPSSVWPELRPGWRSVEGAFTRKQDAEQELSRQIHERTDRQIAEGQRA